MKQIITLFTAIIMTASIFAQAPDKMSYQAVIRNGSNALVASTTVGMRLSILQGSANGTAVYVETQTPSTNANGLASVEIGGGNVVSGNFTNINWANGPYFIKTETDPAGGSNYSIIGTNQLLSVPYALYAKSAGSVNGGSGGFTHYIGEEFGGGVIFHIWKDAQGVEHGLIVDKTDLSIAQVWSNIDQTLIGPSAQSTWDGLSNSNAILGQIGHTNSAAAICLNSTNGGQSDWYLPAIDELERIYQNRLVVNASLRTIGGATEIKRVDIIGNYIFYWSSTEHTNNTVWTFVFLPGSANNVSGKNSTCYVRAVRTF